MQILREAGVKSDWSWEQALRLIIDHPSYKCLPSLAERKDAFSRFKHIERGRERDEQERKDHEAKDAFRRMLDEEPRIQVTTRWPEAVEILGETDEFRAVGSRDRVDLYHEYIGHLKRTVGNERKISPAVIRFGELLCSIPEITVETLWKDAITIFSAHETVISSADLQRLEPIDMLVEFEKYMKVLEQREEQNSRDAHMEARRKERSARKEMLRVIQDLIQKRKFTAITTWRDFMSLTSHLPCFEAMITAHPMDPTPLDFYWDALDALQIKYVPDRRLILDVVGEEHPKDLRKFKDKVKKDAKYRDIKETLHIELAFRELSLRPTFPQTKCSNLPPKPIPAGEVDRKLIEQYKHMVKYWSDPPITLVSTYEQFRPLFQAREEFLAVTDESVRRLYFDKYILHLKRKSSVPPAHETKIDVPEEGEVVEEDYRPTRSRSRY